ncbi:glycoside hydrolase family 6 protein [Labedaea rhizosphaerae]|uniref:Glucanase n=1 Tax=Labedaea rhizosphaerae TaxID=598644 RepID=A0A4R6SDQ9_LABRH|nr:glycoside hydrolase family 6 protein [Labedaea rhizosphaerae]TDP97773.1 cellulose 1,4-beta-cellobiosidase [Labedaea rhizosphaerae]
MRIRARRRSWAAGAALAIAAASLSLTAAAVPASAATLDNPYAGATPYVNPEWSSQAAADGGSAIANQPTFVWLDRMAAIGGVNGGMGLRAHLDKALSQGANLIQFVIYDLPNRDCAALASNGEIPSGGLSTYEHSYIDPIAAIMSDSKYAGLRIVNLIEPDSLPNLVTNAGSQAGSTDACRLAKQTGDYVNGVGYALGKLGALPNVYNYIDAGHHAWLGWDTNFSPFGDVALQAATSNGASVNDVTGFITNTANYSALKEPYFTVNDTVNGQTVRQSKWVDWNYYVDELPFAQNLRTMLVGKGFNAGLGMLIDTGRNGWGGANRPTHTSTATTVDAYVNESRTDRRIHPGNWCNQVGAGIGERPKAAPASGVDAYVWAKPPGESDGASQPIANDEGKGFDQMCDPTYGGNARNGNNPTGAMDGSPLAGHWFSAQFHQLLANAYPPIGTSNDTTPPSAPSGVTVTGTTSSSVSLSWSASTDNVGVTGYDVYRNGSKVGTASSTTFTDTGLTASTQYTYTVKAHDAAGNASTASSPVTATTQSGNGGDTTPPSTPSSVTVTGTTSSSVSLSWSASTDNVGVTGYDVYRNGSKVGTASSTTFTDTGLTASTQYTYTVKAHDAAGNASTASSPVTATTQSGGTGNGCTATYHVDNDWGSGFTATVTVKNTGTATTRSWKVTWAWGGNQQVTGSWNTSLTQSGTGVTAGDLGYNGAVAPGQTTTFGFQATYSGSNPAPTFTCTAG